MKALIISPWFGPLPPWFEQFKRRLVGQRFQWYIPTDLAAFHRRVREILGVDPVNMNGTGKIHDYRPCFGEIYAKELEGYEWWANTDLDIVYGRLERFYTDELVADLDIFSDCEGYVGGPLSFFRNTPEVSSIFREFLDWKDVLRDPLPHGWIETSYSRLIEGNLRYRYWKRHAHTDDFFLARGPGRRLMHFGEEIPFFHFRYSKRWPLEEESSQG